MPDEALRMPMQLRDCRFIRTTQCDEFARFLLETEQGSYRPDPDFGCRSSYFTPEHTDDLRTVVRNHILDQFRRYMGITVNVAISDNVSSPTASFKCIVSGTGAKGNRFDLSWEI
jgi:hypothetical protein